MSSVKKISLRFSFFGDVWRHRTTEDEQHTDYTIQRFKILQRISSGRGDGHCRARGHIFFGGQQSQNHKMKFEKVKVKETPPTIT